MSQAMHKAPGLEHAFRIEVPRTRPDFLVVGAQKAGTTSLHTWLAALPGISLPRDKETHYLTHPERSALGATWYDEQFAQGPGGLESSRLAHQLVGEVDPELLHHPRAAQRVREIFGSPKIVIILRDPLARARSQHAMSVARGLEPLGFVEALEAEAERLDQAGPDAVQGRHQAYLGRSRYGTDVQRYLDQFGTQGVLLLRFEELFQPESASARLESFGRLLRFIGYRSEARIKSPKTVRNASWDPRIKVLARLLHGQGGLRRVLGRMIPTRALRRQIGSVLDSLNRRPTKARPQAFPQELPAHLAAAFDGEVRRVEHLTGWDCRSWRAGATASQAGWEL